MMFVIVVSSLKTQEIVSAIGPFETEQEAQTGFYDGTQRDRASTRSVAGSEGPTARKRTLRAAF
jgi:hypothetical protein